MDGGIQNSSTTRSGLRVTRHDIQSVEGETTADLITFLLQQQQQEQKQQQQQNNDDNNNNNDNNNEGKR